MDAELREVVWDAIRYGGYPSDDVASEVVDDWAWRTADEVITLVRTANGWQPIETAPKDGTYVLTSTPEWGVSIERWNGRDWTEYADNDGSDCEAGPPTHWMPLPSPPQGLPPVEQSSA